MSLSAHARGKLTRNNKRTVILLLALSKLDKERRCVSDPSTTLVWLHATEQAATLLLKEHSIGDGVAAHRRSKHFGRAALILLSSFVLLETKT
jgi:hypothetical protein